METFFIRALQLVLSLSILVVLHEFGHFAFSRLFKVRVEKFYMFFNPAFSLLRAKKINGKWVFKFFAKNVPANERPRYDADGDAMVDEKGKQIMEPIPPSELPDGDWRKYPESTEWGIGWLPLGGYCKIAGMVDESMDKTQLQREPQSWEYRSRSVWQRLPIIIGGVLVNFILAMVIFSAVLFTWGEDYTPLSSATYGMQFSPVMQEYGFKNGDKIMKVNGSEVEKRSDLIQKILIEGNRNVTVVRDSQTLDFTLPVDFAQKVLKADETDLVSFRIPYVIAEITSGMPASAAGLQSGDSVVGLNGKKMVIFQDIAAGLDEQRGKKISLEYYRAGKLMKSDIQLDESGKLGVSVVLDFSNIPSKHVQYGFFESIPAGINLGWETLTSYVKQLKLVFTKEGSKQLGGFGSIGKMFPRVWDWQSFWSLTALLSVVLAFMNFLPIPALDGGYVMFLLYEMFTGRKPNDKFLEYAQTAGMLLLFALLLFANGNDIFKAFFK
ncbi:MAG TPA: RIP metalloprotease RseP [Paludibacter sp.]|nr:RIP metalloprotease RseP [Paludibacter sp.]